MKRIPVSSPALIGREKEYVIECLDRNELSSVGAFVRRLEAAFAAFCGVSYAVACSNGTSALHLSLLALKVKPGDKVIVPALTYVATANAVRYCGAEPIFCDVDPDTWCIDVDDVSRKIAKYPDVVGVIAVHLYGVPADMGALSLLASKNGLWLVEDAAEAHGARLDGAMAGAMGDVGVFSFYGNKIITCGEGGILTTDNPYIAQRARLYRGQGVDEKGGRYVHSVVGYNYRLTNIQAAIALAQLEQFAEHAARRRAVFDSYRRLLSDRYVTQRTRGTIAEWMFSVLMPDGVDRDAVAATLYDHGIETRPFFVPLTDLPPYSGHDTPPVTADLSRRGLNLPTHARLSQPDILRVAELLNHAVQARV